MLDIPAPGRDDEYRWQMWVLWRVLEYMRNRAQSDEHFVPAGRLREYARDYTISDDTRDDVLRVLRRSCCIARQGNASKSAQYFLTEVGDEIRQIYQRKLMEAVEGL